MDERLINYVWKYLQSGYQEDSIKDALIKYGYDEATINEAITVARQRLQQAPGQQVRSGPASKTYLLGMMLIILLIIGGAVGGISYTMIAQDTTPTIITPRPPSQPQEFSNNNDNSEQVATPPRQDESVAPPVETVVSTPNNQQNSGISAQEAANNLGQLSLLNTEEKTELERLIDNGDRRAMGICLEKDSETNKNNCLQKVGIELTLEEACDQITTSTSRNRCYLGMVTKNKAFIQVCDKIDEIGQRNMCLTAGA